MATELGGREAAPNGFDTLERVLAGISDAFVTLDRAWRCTYVNPRAAEFSGLPAEAMLGRTLWELFPAVLGTDMEAACRRAVATGRTERCEYHDAPLDRWFEQRLYPTADGLSILSTDITDRRRADERRAEQALDRYRLLFQHAQDIVLFIRADGGIAEANDAAVAAYGYDRATLLGMTVFHLRAAATVGATVSQMLQADRDGITFETLHRRRDGTTFPVEVSSRGAEVAGERLLLSIIRDVTERKRGEEALRRSEEQLRAAFSAARMVGWAYDPAAERTTRSDNVAEVFGFVPGDTAEDGWRTMLPEDRERHEAIVAAALTLRAGYTSEFRVRRPDTGEVRWLEDHGQGEWDADDRLVRVAGIIIDVTGRKRAEEALKEADRRKDEFLAMLAHELRNPLAPILNAVEVLRLLDPNDGMLRQQRDTIERQVEQMRRLLDDLLDVSRITRGKVQLRHEVTDLAAVLAGAIETSRPLLEAKQHVLSVTLPPRPVLLEADPTRLAQVFTNLLNNAAKYTDAGGHVWLTLEQHGTEATVRVRDSGIGMTGEMLAHAFELFAQADRSLDRSQGGLGIGLTLARQLVEMHGGTIAAASDGPGRGCEFVVRLPAQPATLDVAEAVPREPAARAPRRPRRVLIVDDNQDAAESLALLLQLRGHDVRTALDGPGGLEAADAFGPEVVLLDIGLPGMDGYEVARQLRQRPAGRATMLVAVTGYGGDEDRRRSREAGFDHHLVKPTDPETVVDLLACV
jgi:PAS domain S-box-containing protein